MGVKRYVPQQTAAHWFHCFIPALRVTDPIDQAGWVLGLEFLVG